MRKWHRWLSVLFGVFLLWIAGTGLASHVTILMAEAEAPPPAASAAATGSAIGDLLAPPAQAHEGEEDEAVPPPPAAAAAAAVPAGFTCPEGWRCFPVPPPGEGGMREWVGFLHHLHSGEAFGPLGTAISMLSGLALLFFAFSGLWMYLRMWGTRKRRHLNGLFWK